MFERFAKLFKTRNLPADNSFDRTTLPRSVMESILLNEKQEIGVTEIRRLIRDGEGQGGERPDLANAAFFCIMKVGASDPEFQKIMIRELVSRLAHISVADDRRTREIVRDLCEESLPRIAPGQTIGAAKLKRMNLRGFLNTDDFLKDEAMRLAKDPRDVFIVANSMLVGLSGFVRVFRDVNKSFFILLPSNFPKNGESLETGQKANFPPGFKISPDGEVTVLERNFTRPSNVVIVDDIRDKGETEERILRYWTASGAQAPTFEPIEKIGKSLESGPDTSVVPHPYS
jgi:hypothetical protein